MKVSGFKFQVEKVESGDVGMADRAGDAVRTGRDRTAGRTGLLDLPRWDLRAGAGGTPFGTVG